MAGETREIPLTHGFVTLVDAADYERLAKHHWWCSNPKLRHNYAMRKIVVDGKKCALRLHREIIPCPEGKVIDHINGNTLDNRRANLQAVTQTENTQKMARRAGSRFRGVCRPNPRGSAAGRWLATITINSRHKFLGYFASAEEAARAYDVAATKHYGRFANLNFPDQAEAA